MVIPNKNIRHTSIIFQNSEVLGNTGVIQQRTIANLVDVQTNRQANSALEQTPERGEDKQDCDKTLGRRWLHYMIQDFSGKKCKECDQETGGSS